MDCNVPEKYDKLIQDIVRRLPNNGARFAGGESNIFNEDVWFAPMICLESTPDRHTHECTNRGVRQ